MYREVLHSCGCCGFVAWVGGRIAGYNNFFPREWARKIGFYGWGREENTSPRTLVHNCISIKLNERYRRKGIGTSLIEHSLDWAKQAGWKRFEVHLVTADSPAHFDGEQKSCRGFWTKLGFHVLRTEGQGENGRFCMTLDLDEWGS